MWRACRDQPVHFKSQVICDFATFFSCQSRVQIVLHLLVTHGFCGHDQVVVAFRSPVSHVGAGKFFDGILRTASYRLQRWSYERTDEIIRADPTTIPTKGVRIWEKNQSRGLS